MLNNKYSEIDLPQFIDKIDSEYVLTLKSCDTAERQVTAIKTLEGKGAISQYVALCGKLIDEIQEILGNRQKNLIPYMEHLSDKLTAETSKRRSRKSVASDKQHDSLKDSIKEIRKIISKLQVTALPLYSDKVDTGAYRSLRSQMIGIESSLNELLYNEENYLLPKIKEAQDKIYGPDK